MRTPLAIALGIVIGGAVVLTMAEGLRRGSFASKPDAHDSSSEKVTAASSSSGGARVTQSSTTEPPPVSDRDAARPSTPVYQPRPEEPRAIYRCRSDGRTIYSNTPCTNGTVVDDSNAVAGFDSRPSAVMERLVAEGRARPTVEAPAPRMPAQNALPAPEYDQCASMRRQIIDIDNFTRYPHSLPTLDYWRGVRQDIRTSMAREHC